MLGILKFPEIDLNWMKRTPFTLCLPLFKVKWVVFRACGQYSKVLGSICFYILSVLTANS